MLRCYSRHGVPWVTWQLKACARILRLELQGDPAENHQAACKERKVSGAGLCDKEAGNCMIFFMSGWLPTVVIIPFQAFLESRCLETMRCSWGGGQLLRPCPTSTLTTLCPRPDEDSGGRLLCMRPFDKQLYLQACCFKFWDLLMLLLVVYVNEGNWGSVRWPVWVSQLELEPGVWLFFICPLTFSNAVRPLLFTVHLHI